MNGVVISVRVRHVYCSMGARRSVRVRHVYWPMGARGSVRVWVRVLTNGSSWFGAYLGACLGTCTDQ